MISPRWRRDDGGVTVRYTPVKSPGRAPGCASIVAVVSLVCRPHHRAAVAECAGCGDALCDSCAGAGDDRCLQCSSHRADARAMERFGRESRAVMRRSGIAVHRRQGDPVVLREGPLRMAVTLAGVGVTALGAALVAVLVDHRWGVDVALTGIGLALFVGVAVRTSFGGVSREAGLVAVAVCVGGIAAAQRLASDHGEPSVAILGTASAWLLGHGAAAIACYAVAAALAYGAAAGRRVV